MKNVKRTTMCLILLASLVISLSQVAVASAQQTPPLSGGGRDYSEIINHSIQVVDKLLTKWGTPPDSEARRALKNASNSLIAVSRAEDVEIAREYFLEGMSHIHSAVSLAARDYVGSEEFRMMVEIMKSFQEVEALNETLRNLELRLLRMGEASMLQQPTVDSYLSIINNLSVALTGLREHLNAAVANPNNYDRDYISNELNRVREQVRKLSRELSDVHIIEVREKFKARINERLNNLSRDIDGLRRKAEELRKWGVPSIARVADERVKGLAEAVSRLRQLLNVSDGFDWLDVIELSNVKEVLDALSLSMDNLNNLFEELHKFKESFIDEVIRIKEVSDVLERRLESDGKLSQQLRERIAEVIKVSNQIVNGGDELMKQLMSEALSARDFMKKFEIAVKDGQRRSQELRNYLGLHDKHPDLIPLIDNVENSLNNVLRNVGKFNESIGRIEGWGYGLAEKILLSGMRDLEELNMCRADPSTKKLLNNALTLVGGALKGIKAGDLENARNYLMLALSTVEDLNDRFPHPHNLRVRSLAERIRLVLNTLQDPS